MEAYQTDGLPTSPRRRLRSDHSSVAPVATQFCGGVSRARGRAGPESASKPASHLPYTDKVMNVAVYVARQVCETPRDARPYRNPILGPYLRTGPYILSAVHVAQ